jgi:hypothetical protein
MYAEQISTWMVGTVERVSIAPPPVLGCSVGTVRRAARSSIPTTRDPAPLRLHPREARSPGRRGRSALRPLREGTRFASR